MIIVQKIECTNDANGNPRRGWLVWQIHHVTGVLTYLRFVDEGYSGTSALRSELTGTVVAPEDPAYLQSTREWMDANKIMELGVLQVTITQYNTLKRDRGRDPRA